MYSRYFHLKTTAGCFGKNPCCSILFFSGASCFARVFTRMEVIKNKLKDCFSSRGCFGCLTKPSVVVTVDEPAKGLGNQDRSVRKDSILDDFWSSSTAEMEHSQRSLSSVSPFNQPLNSCHNPSSTNKTSEFVNHGALLWSQMRHDWLGNKRLGNGSQLREPTISLDATDKSLLGTNIPFPRPVPLAEIVDLLCGVWEREGLHD